MSPSEFMRLYRSMVVKLDDASLVNADVHQYMINTASNTRVANAKVMWDQINTALNDEVKGDKKASAAWTKAHNIGPAPPASREWILSRLDPSVSYSLLSAVHYGKGSPAANKVFIALAVRYGFADPTKLADFTDKYMGLDCSGFVSNYLVQQRMLPASEVVNRNAHSYDVAAHRRAKREDVQRYDLLVWSDTNHIAVIDTEPDMQYQLVFPKPVHHRPVAGPAERVLASCDCDVVESNGSQGLHCSRYKILSVDSFQVFTVQRPNGSKMHVHIINQGITG